MKKMLSVLLTPIVILIFCSAAFGQNGEDAGKYEKIVKVISAKKAEAPAPLLAYQNQKENHVRFDFTKRRCWFCTPCFATICDKLCGDVSPSKPGGGSKKWGKKCSPGMERKCERCGFIQ